MTVGSERAQFELNDAEIQQSMTLNRMDFAFLVEFLGLVSATSSIAPTMLLAERIHVPHYSEALKDYLVRLGAEQLERLRSLGQRVLCEEWGFCRRRATEGFGDPRHLTQLIARLIGEHLEEIGIPFSRTSLITCSVVLSRVGLTDLCEC